MRRGDDVALRLPGLCLVHHNLPGKKVGWHQWRQHTIFIPLQGELNIELGSTKLTCGPGRMIYVSPETSFRFSSSELAGERLICMIDAPAWGANTRVRCEPAVRPVPRLCDEILFYLLMNPKTAAVKALIACLVQVLAECLRPSKDPVVLDISHLESKVRDPRLRNALAIMRSSAIAPLRITSVAHEAGLSVRNLTRLFRQEIGHTPKQVATQLRIAAARDHLLSGHSVSESAFLSGYQSLAQFVRQFHRLTGQLPKDLKRLGRKE